MTQARFKIFGERNSGTNLLRQLVGDIRFLPDDTGLTPFAALNAVALQAGRLAPRLYDKTYDLVTLKRHDEILGWKHALPPIELLETSYVVPVVIVKHPSFWLRSFLDKPFHHYSGSRRYFPRRIENISRIDIDIEDLILKKYTGYRAAVERFNGIVVQYETLVTHFPDAQERLKSFFGHCHDLPRGEVRDFVKSRELSFVDKHSNESLRALKAFDHNKLKSHLNLLGFFGYGTDKWEITQPFSL